MDELDEFTKEAWELTGALMKVCNDYSVATVGTALTFAMAVFAMHNEAAEANTGMADIRRCQEGIEKLGAHFIGLIQKAKADGRDVMAEIMSMDSMPMPPKKKDTTH